MRLLALFAVLGLSVAPALAGDEEGRCLSGFGCDNLCPLAQQANSWRSAGTEALAVKSRVQADWAALVTKNLGRIG